MKNQKKEQKVNVEALEAMLMERDSIIEDLNAKLFDCRRDVVELKHQVASYKSANTKYRNEIERLKFLGKEGDELNEEKAAKIGYLQNVITEYASHTWFHRIFHNIEAEF